MTMEESGENLIFIICAPRTGSTLLQQMLASHSEVHTLAAPCIMNFLMYGLRKDDGLRPIGIETEYNALYTNYNVSLFLNKLPGKTSVFYEAARKAALHMYGKALEGTGKKFFLDKSVRYYLFIPELFKTFPKAKFILLVRNPIAQFASSIRAWVKNGDWKQMRFRYTDFCRSQFLMRDAMKNFGDQASFVRYEELATSPEETVKRICADINLTYEDAILNYEEQIKGKSGIDIVGLGDVTSLCKHQKPVSQYIDNWPDSLNTSQNIYYAKCFMKDLGRELYDDLGYSFDDVMATLAQKKVDESEIHYTWDLVSDIELSEEKIREQEDKDRHNNPPVPIESRLKEVKEKTVHSGIVNEWRCRFGMMKGMCFTFNADGTFERNHETVTSRMVGDYKIDESVTPHLIDMNVKEHSAGAANIGVWKGIFEVENNVLKIRYGFANAPRWTDSNEYQHYYRMDFN